MIDIKDVLNLYWQHNITGGNLHVILDDGNVGDTSVTFSMGVCQRAGDVAGIMILAHLEDMTPEERLEFISNVD